MRIALAVLLLAGGLWGQVTSERLGRAAQEPQNWLTYSGTYMSQRYSLLDQITRHAHSPARVPWRSL